MLIMENQSPPIENNTTLDSPIDDKLLKMQYKNQALSDEAHWALIVFYSILIVLGSFGNFFVILAVISNKGK